MIATVHPFNKRTTAINSGSNSSGSDDDVALFKKQNKQTGNCDSNNNNGGSDDYYSTKTTVGNGYSTNGGTLYKIEDVTDDPRVNVLLFQFLQDS